MSHLNQDEMLAFAAGRSDERQAERVYEHLDECGACAERYEAVQLIRSDFDESWDAFLGEFQARALRDEAAPESISVDLAIRGLLDGTRKLATAALDSVGDLVQGLGGLDVSFQPAYSGVGDPDKAGGAARITRDASELVGEGKDSEAITNLREAQRLDPRGCSRASLDLRKSGSKVGEIVVDASRRSVSVLVLLDRSDGAGGVAVLSSENDGVKDRRIELETVEGAHYSLAEFEDVPDGPFSLRIELSVK